MSTRLLKVFLNLGRWRQVRRCALATRQWPRLTAAYVGIRVPLPFTITLASGSFEFREFSDIPTFWQIFFRDEYPVRTDDRVIIDAGANIGAFTYCMLRAPQATVIAVEPAPDSCARLRDMIVRHGFADRCTIHGAALAGTLGKTSIDLKAASQFRVSGAGGVEVPAVTLDSIAAPFETVDLLKIDTEGAEYQVLPATTTNTLNRIRR